MKERTKQNLQKKIGTGQVTQVKKSKITESKIRTKNAFRNKEKDRQRSGNGGKNMKQNYSKQNDFFFFLWIKKI